MNNLHRNVLSSSTRTCTGAVVNSLQRQWRTRCCERQLRAFITRDESLGSSWEETRADLSSPLGTRRNLSKCISKRLKLFSLKIQWFINTSAGAGVMKAIWFEGICCQSTNGLIHPARFVCTLDFCGKQVMLSSNAQKRTFPSGTLALKVPWSALKHAALFYVVR